MVFITRCWKKLCQPNPQKGVQAVRLRAWCLGVVAGLCWLLSPVAHAQTTVELLGLKAERQETALVLSGKWRYELSAAMQDALLKGIALHFVSEADITRERWYFYEKRIAHAERHHRLSYLPLTQRWRLNSANQAMALGGLGVSLGQTFDTLEEATTAMQRISQWRVAADIDGDAGYTLEMKFRLDLTQLPRPLQIGATGQNEWNLSFNKRMPLVVESTR
jgi:hypothetical protein